MKILLTLALKSEIVRDSHSSLKLLTFSTFYVKELETIKILLDIKAVYCQKSLLAIVRPSYSDSSLYVW